MITPEPIQSSDVHGPQRRALHLLAGIVVFGLGAATTGIGVWMLQASWRTEWRFGSPLAVFTLLTLVGVVTAAAGWRMTFRPEWK